MKSNIPTALLMVVSASALTGCFTTQYREEAYRPHRTILATDRVELPVTFVGNYPVVEVRINGAGPFRLMLDSGCSNLMLSRRAAELAQIKRSLFSAERVTVNGGKGIEKHSTAQVERLEAGGLKLEGVKALVESKQARAVDAAGIQKSMDVAGFGSLDGVLGMAALYDLILEIDYPNRQVAAVRLGTGGLPPERAIPYDLERGVGFVTLDMGGKTVRALVDTGSNGGFEISNMDEVSLLYPKQKVDGMGAYGAGGQEARQTWGQLEGDIFLGPITWRNAIVTGSGNNGAVIGSRALKPWKVVFYQRGRQLYLLDGPALVAAQKLPMPDARFKLGFFCEFHRGGIRLLEVDSGCALEQAGLRAGDVICTVDGFDAADWVSGHVPSEILTRPRVALSVERDERTFEAILVQGPDN